jgi:hypothetical protein
MNRELRVSSYSVGCRAGPLRRRRVRKGCSPVPAPKRLLTGVVRIPEGAGTEEHLRCRRRQTRDMHDGGPVERADQEGDDHEMDDQRMHGLPFDPIVQIRSPRVYGSFPTLFGAPLAGTE